MNPFLLIFFPAYKYLIYKYYYVLLFHFSVPEEGEPDKNDVGL